MLFVLITFLNYFRLSRNNILETKDRYGYNIIELYFGNI